MPRLKKGAVTSLLYFGASLTSAVAAFQVEYFDKDRKFWKEFDAQSNRIKRVEPVIHRVLENSYSQFLQEKAISGPIIKNSRETGVLAFYNGIAGNIIGLFFGFAVPQGGICNPFSLKSNP